MTAIGSEPCAGRVHQDDSGTAGATTTAALAGADRVTEFKSLEGRRARLGKLPAWCWDPQGLGRVQTQLWAQTAGPQPGAGAPSREGRTCGHPGLESALVGAGALAPSDSRRTGGS